MYNKVEICGVNTSKLIVLTEEKKRELLKKSQAGDRIARDELINGNLRLVLSVMQSFLSRGVPPDDLFQVGCIGLIKAVDNFNLEIDVKFSTYAVPMNAPCGEGNKMTRKQALTRVLELINEEDIKKVIVELIEELPMTIWSERTIFDTLNQFVVENKRMPLSTDLNGHGMPTHPVIANRFKMKTADFLKKYYPHNKKVLVRYWAKSIEDWKEDFIEQYNSMAAYTGQQYNQQRRKGTPTWKMLALKYNCSQWNQWLIYCGLEKRKFEQKKPNINVSSSYKIESSDN